MPTTTPTKIINIKIITAAVILTSPNKTDDPALKIADKIKVNRTTCITHLKLLVFEFLLFLLIYCLQQEHIGIFNEGAALKTNLTP
jgi:hypothetical protein